MYLTLAPYGGNLEGVRAASLFYFGKEPGQLTRRRGGAARGACRSRRRRFGPTATPPPRSPPAAGCSRAWERSGSWRRPFGRGGGRSRCPSERRRAVHRPPHLAERLRAARPGSSVDSHDHRRRFAGAARGAGGALSDRSWSRGPTIALLVVENGGRKVRAYVGSGDYFDSRPARPERHGAGRALARLDPEAVHLRPGASTICSSIPRPSSTIGRCASATMRPRISTSAIAAS